MNSRLFTPEPLNFVAKHSHRNRREVIRIGGLGWLGGHAMSSLDQLYAAQNASNSANSQPMPLGFGKAKRCILLFMWGGLDWFMSFQEVDIYYDWFGIYLPDAIYNYSHWIAMGVGSMLVAAGNQSK